MSHAKILGHNSFLLRAACKHYINGYFSPTFQPCHIWVLKMCRGVQESNIRGSFCSTGAVSPNAASSLVCCELCDSRASLYCQADDAFLCQKCDKWVHRANFLAFRHIRCLLCNTCQNLTQRYLIGASVEVVLPTIVSWKERRQCNSNLEEQNSRSLKMPFLFL